MDHGDTQSDSAERLRQAFVDSVLPTTSEREGELQRIVEQAAALLKTPIASVSLIDRDRQWFAARVGIDAPETPRAVSICNRVILRPGEPLVILDARQDARYAMIPSVLEAPFVRFYAGIPLVNRAGYALGALCVADTEPRTEVPSLTALERLAREAERIVSGH